MKNLYRTAAVALLALVSAAACVTPQPEPVKLGGQTRYANTAERTQYCVDNNGTPIRDPQPPRPDSDPGPYFICVW